MLTNMWLWIKGVEEFLELLFLQVFSEFEAVSLKSYKKFYRTFW